MKSVFRVSRPKYNHLFFFPELFTVFGLQARQQRTLVLLAATAGARANHIHALSLWT